MTDDAKSLDQETCEKLFLCEGEVIGLDSPRADIAGRIDNEATLHAQAAIHRSLDSNNKLFQEECGRIDRWAQDIEDAAELALKQTKKRIDEVRKRLRQAPTVDEQLSLQTEMQSLEKQKKQQRRELDDVEDETAKKRDQLIERIKRRMAHQQTVTTLFTLRWEVV